MKKQNILATLAAVSLIITPTVFAYAAPKNDGIDKPRETQKTRISKPKKVSFLDGGFPSKRLATAKSLRTKLDVPKIKAIGIAPEPKPPTPTPRPAAAPREQYEYILVQESDDYIESQMKIVDEVITSRKEKHLPIGDKIVASAKKYIGVPYVWGGDTPNGFDCSGLVQYVYAQNGISLPRDSYGQSSAMNRTDTPIPGDVIHWPGHVGIYIGEGLMIHAPYPGSAVEVTGVYPGAVFKTIF